MRWTARSARALLRQARIRSRLAHKHSTCLCVLCVCVCGVLCVCVCVCVWCVCVCVCVWCVVLVWVICTDRQRGLLPLTTNSNPMPLLAPVTMIVFPASAPPFLRPLLFAFVFLTHTSTCSLIPGQDNCRRHASARGAQCHGMHCDAGPGLLTQVAVAEGPLLWACTWQTDQPAPAVCGSGHCCFLLMRGPYAWIGYGVWGLPVARVTPRHHNSSTLERPRRMGH